MIVQIRVEIGGGSSMAQKKQGKGKKTAAGPVITGGKPTKKKAKKK